LYLWKSIGLNVHPEKWEIERGFRVLDGSGPPRNIKRISEPNSCQA